MVSKEEQQKTIDSLRSEMLILESDAKIAEDRYAAAWNKYQEAKKVLAHLEEVY